MYLHVAAPPDAPGDSRACSAVALGMVGIQGVCAGASEVRAACREDKTDTEMTGGWEAIRAIYFEKIRTITLSCYTLPLLGKSIRRLLMVSAVGGLLNTDFLAGTSLIASTFKKITVLMSHVIDEATADRILFEIRFSTITSRTTRIGTVFSDMRHTYEQEGTKMKQLALFDLFHNLDIFRYSLS